VHREKEAKVVKKRDILEQTRRSEIRVTTGHTGQTA
jgi:hypothetical protein